MYLFLIDLIELWAWLLNKQNYSKTLVYLFICLLFLFL